MQIRVRLTLQFLMIVAGILLAVLFIIKFQFKKNLEQEYHKRLRWNAYMIGEMVVGSKTDEHELKLEYPLDFSGGGGNEKKAFRPRNNGCKEIQCSRA